MIAMIALAITQIRIATCTQIQNGFTGIQASR
jgi:hypothetical protein